MNKKPPAWAEVRYKKGKVYLNAVHILVSLLNIQYMPLVKQKLKDGYTSTVSGSFKTVLKKPSLKSYNSICFFYTFKIPNSAFFTAVKITVVPL